MLSGLPPGAVPPARRTNDALADDDLHLALYCLYELHYRGFAGVDPSLEWDLGLLSFRATLEAAFSADLLDRVGDGTGVDPRDELTDLATNGDGPSLSGYMRDHGTLDQARELSVHRSAYQLKEADPHSWALPRLTGRAKAAMLKIQADEYGDGELSEMHAELFATTMSELGLDATYGAYLDHLPGVTLATVNLISMFGLHRRWLGAVVGHLALFEMTSVEPMRSYSAGLDRLGASAAARRFYDVHVAVDAVHRHIAFDDMVAGLLEDAPELGPHLVFGARALTLVERRFTEHTLSAWEHGATSLRPAAAPVAA